RNAALDYLRRAASGRDALAFGIVGAALVLPALLDGRRRRVALAFLAIGLAALVFALGPTTPLFRLLLHLPALAWFRVPHYDLLVVDFACAMLAAIGLDAVIATPVRRLPVATAIVGSAALVVAALAGWIDSNAPVAVGACAVAALMASLVAPPARRRWLG